MGQVKIVDFEPKYAAAFRDLNYAWIEQYFEIEPIDAEQLQHPQRAIIAPGGAILIALVDGKPVGTCALDKHGPGIYELSKMAVDPSQRGRGVGLLLGKATIDRAIQLGAEELFLDSNTTLKPAIRLYHRLGFKKIDVGDTNYGRCNIRMAFDLSSIA